MELENDIKNLIILSTGGTIEKVYNENDGSLDNNTSVIMQSIVSKMRLPYTNVEVEVIMAKDSLYMTDEDREFICHTIEERQQAGCPIIVLHGTDTLEVTQRYCFEKIPKVLVPVVFTGAMRPLEFANTDAFQNVTEALMAAKLLEPGIYVSFHNKVFRAPNIRKNRKDMTFEYYGGDE